MWDVLEGAEINSLVVSVLPAGHVTVITDDLTDVLRRHVLEFGVRVRI